jgi:hypothetical protein
MLFVEYSDIFHWLRRCYSWLGRVVVSGSNEEIDAATQVGEARSLLVKSWILEWNRVNYRFANT